MSYPPGNIIICRFAFLTHTITEAEESAFLEGLGLPTGAGLGVTEALFDYWPPGGAKTTIPPVEDATGAYHATLPVETPGPWYYRGRALNSLGEPVAATPRRAFTVGGG